MSCDLSNFWTDIKEFDFINGPSIQNQGWDQNLNLWQFLNSHYSKINSNQKLAEILLYSRDFIMK